MACLHGRHLLLMLLLEFPELRCKGGMRAERIQPTSLVIPKLPCAKTSNGGLLAATVTQAPPVVFHNGIALLSKANTAAVGSPPLRKYFALMRTQTDIHRPLFTSPLLSSLSREQPYIHHSSHAPIGSTRTRTQYPPYTYPRSRSRAQSSPWRGRPPWTSG